MSFSVKILGSSSALPTSTRFPSSQLVTIDGHSFLIDCGEGTQVQLRKFKVGFSRINHIFISHLHGDHFYGLPGLISSLGLLGRKKELHIYGFPELEIILNNILKHTFINLPFTVHFHHLSAKEPEIILENKKVICKSFPLKHSVNCCGFIIEEQPKLPNIRKEMIEQYHIPIRDIVKIKEGADYTTEDGEYIPHETLTMPPSKPGKYAYCSDTIYSKEIVPHIKEADILFHEATFLDEDKEFARQTMHSTTYDAAGIAKEAKAGKLIIGHFSTRYKDESLFEKEAKEIFPNTVAVNDGDSFTIEN